MAKHGRDILLKATNHHGDSSWTKHEIHTTEAKYYLYNAVSRDIMDILYQSTSGKSGYIWLNRSELGQIMINDNSHPENYKYSGLQRLLLNNPCENNSFWTSIRCLIMICSTQPGVSLCTQGLLHSLPFSLNYDPGLSASFSPCL